MSCNVESDPEWIISKIKQCIALYLSVLRHSLAMTRLLSRGGACKVVTLLFQTVGPAVTHVRPHVRLRPGEARRAQRLQEGEAGQRQHPGGRHHCGEWCNSGPQASSFIFTAFIINPSIFYTSRIPFFILSVQHLSVRMKIFSSIWC